MAPSKSVKAAPTTDPSNTPATSTASRTTTATSSRRTRRDINEIIRLIQKRIQRRRHPLSRILFPPGATENAEERLTAAINSMSQRVHDRRKREFLAKWNFDIDEEKPVSGAYKWEKTC